VFGIEGAVLGGSLKNTVVRPGRFSDNTLNNTISGIYTLSARVGVSWDRLLAYGKAGYASARVRIRAGEEPAFPHFLADSVRHNGFVLGIGGEYQILPNWIFGVEYNYIDLRAKNHNGVDNVAFDPFYTIRVDPTVHTIMARFSYLIPFGGPGRAAY
jgi:opacity protein-like surface antigen